MKRNDTMIESFQSSPGIRNSTSRSSNQSQNNAEDKERKIARLLAVRSYHLPGYNWCQDYVSWFKNNHPLLGLCCRHRLNPIGTGPRLIILLSSVCFGLIATNLVYLYYRYYDGNNRSIIKIDIGNDPEAYLAHIEITTESVVLWTIGGLVHSMIDLGLWHLTACACCLPGAKCWSKACDCCANLGSYLTILIFSGLTALATLCILLRASYEQKARDNNTTTDDTTAFEVHSLTSFNFLITFGVELLLNYFIWGPLVSTIFFTGAMRGCFPCFDSRHKEIEKQQAESFKFQSQVSQRKRDDIV